MSRLATWLLALVVPRDESESVIGDLTEEWHDRRRTMGERAVIRTDASAALRDA